MVKTICQKIIFKNINAKKLYSMYLDSKMHSAITDGKKASITAKIGSSYSANNNSHHGKILDLIKDKLIVQTFIASDWDKEEESLLILYFEQKGKDALITMTHANLPDRQAKAIDLGWKKFYWNLWKKYLAKNKQ